MGVWGTMRFSFVSHCCRQVVVWQVCWTPSRSGQRWRSQIFWRNMECSPPESPSENVQWFQGLVLARESSNRIHSGSECVEHWLPEFIQIQTDSQICLCAVADLGTDGLRKYSNTFAKMAGWYVGCLAGWLAAGRLGGWLAAWL